MKTIKLLHILAVLLLAIGCKEPYLPPIKSDQNSYLVVESYLNGQGTTTLKLSRTYKLDDSTGVRPELNAIVQVESQSSGQVSRMDHKGNGIYETVLSLTTTDKYRVKIITSNNKVYVSDFVDYKPTPAIDEISWQRKNDGVQIYANTHDPQNKTIYYRWDYDETWEFHSPYDSRYDFEMTGRNTYVISTRDQSINLDSCWTTQSSTRVILGSSAKLERDVISLSPITFIPNGSWKLGVKYSILVRQYALTEEAFQYWQLLMKNTEQMGTIFDPQPSETVGNIHSVSDPNELVIGFISAGIIQEKRIFITNSELPNWNYVSDCEFGIIRNSPDTLLYFLRGGNNDIVKEAELPWEPGTFGYMIADIPCIDCRTKGANTKPAFW